MMISDHVRQYVADLVVPQSQQMTTENIADLDEQEARQVVADFPAYEVRLAPIVMRLRKFTGKDFPIEFERHYRRGLAKPNGVISLDFATLAKSNGELALIVAHEWAHQSLEHLTSSVSEHDAECQADYWGGIFLGYFHYDLNDVLRIRLSMPATDAQFERACLVAQGYQDGKAMRSDSLHASAWPGFEAFRTHFKVSPWQVTRTLEVNQPEGLASNARKLSR